MPKKVKIEVDSNGCHLWTGRTERGYGKSSYMGHSTLAHRAAWMKHHKQIIPNNMVICHRCNQPLCVNPEHLYLSTQSHNVKSAYEQGRKKAPRLYADKNGMTKLNWDSVERIRSERQQGKTYSQLAKDFNIGRSTIRAICSYRTWKKQKAAEAAFCDRSVPS